MKSLTFPVLVGVKEDRQQSPPSPDHSQWGEGHPALLAPPQSPRLFGATLPGSTEPCFFSFKTGMNSSYLIYLRVVKRINGNTTKYITNSCLTR